MVSAVFMKCASKLLGWKYYQGAEKKDLESSEKVGGALSPRLLTPAPGSERGAPHHLECDKVRPVT